MVNVLVIKTFEKIAEVDNAKYLNRGDFFLSDGHGWVFKVISKVCYMQGDSYHINVMVKPLSKEAKLYATKVSKTYD